MSHRLNFFKKLSPQRSNQEVERRNLTNRKRTRVGKKSTCMNIPEELSHVVFLTQRYRSCPSQEFGGIVLNRALCQAKLHQTGWRYPVGYHRQYGGETTNYRGSTKMFEDECTIFVLRNAGVINKTKINT